MRILVVGAGAIGGYFGGRLLQSGADVTFLVRPKRASELASAGLVIKSPHGDVTLNNPPTVQADQLTEKFDAVLLRCTAFDLDDAIASFAPAVGPDTAIVPMLNGMRHLDVLEKKFSARNVLGGQCQIMGDQDGGHGVRFRLWGAGPIDGAAHPELPCPSARGATSFAASPVRSWSARYPSPRCSAHPCAGR